MKSFIILFMVLMATTVFSITPPTPPSPMQLDGGAAYVINSDGDTLLILYDDKTILL